MFNVDVINRYDVMGANEALKIMCNKFYQNWAVCCIRVSQFDELLKQS